MAPNIGQIGPWQTDWSGSEMKKIDVVVAAAAVLVGTNVIMTRRKKTNLRGRKNAFLDMYWLKEIVLNSYCAIRNA